MARNASGNRLVGDLGGAAQRTARRNENRLRARSAPETDAQGLVAFTCECTRLDCDRTVRVPLYVFERVLEARDQYVLQAGHHAFEHYRTIVSIGLMRIEEKG